MRDELFIRGGVPMTKSEVRAVSLSKLELCGGSVLYDVGAGTGSVCVEALLTCPGILAYALEQKEEALKLLQANKEKFQLQDMCIVPGEAGEQMEGLPCPTHAFIGGTAGNMERILTKLLRKNPHVRVVINVIALETLSQVLSFLKELEIESEIVLMQVSRARQLSGYHMMEGNNPIYIISFGGGRPYAE